MAIIKEFFFQTLIGDSSSPPPPPFPNPRHLTVESAYNTVAKALRTSLKLRKLVAFHPAPSRWP